MELNLVTGEEMGPIIELAVNKALEKFTKDHSTDDEVYIPLSKIHRHFLAFETFYKKNKLKNAILVGKLGLVDADGICYVSRAEVKEYLNSGRS